MKHTILFLITLAACLPCEGGPIGPAPPVQWCEPDDTMGEPEVECEATYQCLAECADACDPECLDGCWLPSPDCLGSICVDELGCEVCP